ncbi:MAG: hypothetical protein QM642_02760 [Edaphocola sp.]
MLRKKLFLLSIAALGTVSAFSQRGISSASSTPRGMQGSSASYGTNIVRVATLAAGDAGVGFGFSYEKILDKNQMIGLSLPFFLYLNDDQFNYYYNYNSNTTQPAFYFAPGIKVYPFGQRRVTYAVGPSFFVGYAAVNNLEIPVWDPNTQTTYYQRGKASRLRIGMLANNYLNVQITEAFSIGAEAGLGVRYIDRERQTVAGNTTSYSNSIQPTGNIGMTLGFRF